MKSVHYPAEWNAAAVIALTAAAIAVLPPVPRLAAIGLLALLPLLAWMVSNSLAWMALFLGAVLLLPPLPVSVGNSGAHPALLLAAFGVYAALLFAHRWTFAKSPIAGPAVALTAFMLLSVPMALIYSGVEIAVGSAVRVLLFAIAAFVFVYVVSGPGQTLARCKYGPAKLLFAGGVLSGVFACVDFFYQLPAPSGYSPQFIWLADRVLRRAQGLFYDAGALGNMCAFFLVMVAAVLLAPNRRGINRWLAAAGAVPLATALVFSYSRASVLTVGVSIAAMLCVRRQEVKWLRTAAAVLAAGLIVSMVVSSLAPGLAQWWWQRAQKTLDLVFSASDAALSGRVLSWQTIASFTMAHPLRAILGVGYKTLPYSDVLGQPVIADNTYLSAFIETGIAGLAALCALHVAILRATWRSARSLDPATAFYGLWAFSFWVGEIVQMGAADLLTYWRLLPVFFFVIGIAVLKAREQSA